jgi:hypothetical protein
MASGLERPDQLGDVVVGIGVLRRRVVHAVGDSVCTTNPTLGRGLSMSPAGAADLVEAVGEHGGDPTALAVALDGRVGDHIAPFYEDQAVADAERLAMLRHTIFDAPATAPPPAGSGRVSYAQLRTAARFDPTAFRALCAVTGMIRRPDEVHADPDVVECVAETLRRHPTAPPVTQPTREQLLAALAR